MIRHFHLILFHWHKSHSRRTLDKKMREKKSVAVPISLATTAATTIFMRVLSLINCDGITKRSRNQMMNKSFQNTLNSILCIENERVVRIHRHRHHITEHTHIEYTDTNRQKIYLRRTTHNQKKQKKLGQKLSERIVLLLIFFLYTILRRKVCNMYVIWLTESSL